MRSRGRLYKGDRESKISPKFLSLLSGSRKFLKIYLVIETKFLKFGSSTPSNWKQWRKRPPPPLNAIQLRCCYQITNLAIYVSWLAILHLCNPIFPYEFLFREYLLKLRVFCETDVMPAVTYVLFTWNSYTNSWNVIPMDCPINIQSIDEKKAQSSH